MLPSRNCKHCRKPADGRVLHDWCVEPWFEANREKLRAKARKVDRAEKRVERAQDREKREKLKKLPDLMKIADREFAAYIRLHDRLAGFDCISSGRSLNWNAGNQVDAGHYRSKGAASHLRYNEDNCHAQSKYENRHRAGNAVEYRIRLIQRIGLARVEALEADNKVHHWTHDELRQIAKSFRARRKELEKQRQE